LPPVWLPGEFVSLVDDRTGTAIDTTQTPSSGGTCTYLRPGILSVKRSEIGVTGCPRNEPLRSTIMTDSAVEARIRVEVGCAGLWARTGAVGYFVAVCASGDVSLHKLGTTDPAASNRLVGWRPTFDPKDVVVGLLVKGDILTVYVNGEQKRSAEDDSIPSGRVNVGGFAPTSDGIDATISDVRVWRLP
jgi:hypothetical protein